MTRFVAVAVLSALTMVGLVGATPPGGSSAQMVSILKNSPAQLAQGAGECSSFAKEYGTLGRLVTAFDKIAGADGDRIVECGRESKEQHGLPCKLRISNHPKRSEEEFDLFIFFELRHQRVSAFKCFIAG